MVKIRLELHFIRLRVVQKQLAATNKNVKFNCPLRPKPGQKSTGSIKEYHKYQKIIQTLHNTLTGTRASYLFGL